MGWLGEVIVKLGIAEGLSFGNDVQRQEQMSAF
jgi:hypothetical protein